MGYCISSFFLYSQPTVAKINYHESIRFLCSIAISCYGELIAV